METKMRDAPTFDMVPSRPLTYLDSLRLHGTTFLVAVAGVMLLTTIAKAESVYVGVEQYPTVNPGIGQAPSYDPLRRGPLVFNDGPLPSARVRHLRVEAPANGCGPNQFEVLNRAEKGPRCYGY